MTIQAAVIGHPVNHSLSPVMHNAAYRHLSIDATYEAIDIEEENATQSIHELFTKGYSYLNVTMPYKELACEISITHGAASRLRSVNTLISDDQGQLHGYSTDGQGFINAMSELGIDLGSKIVMVIGSGAVARVICDALIHEDARVLLAARNLDRAMDVVESVISTSALESSGSRHLDIVEFSRRNERAEECDIIVNATPVGMTRGSKPDRSTPLDILNLSNKPFVFDTIYHPLETELISQARKKGCGTSNGLTMLLHQGALAFSLMWHQEAPVEVMRRALLDQIEGS